MVERPIARLLPLRLGLLLPGDLRVEGLLVEELLRLLVEPVAVLGALAPRLGIFAPDRRASLYDMATACLMAFCLLFGCEVPTRPVCSHSWTVFRIFSC